MISRLTRVSVVTASTNAECWRVATLETGEGGNPGVKMVRGWPEMLPGGLPVHAVRSIWGSRGAGERIRMTAVGVDGGSAGVKES